ncbi:hydroxypyruvate reductase [Aliiroseovarius halocynthiae]|uniref:Glycerate kinase n=1 Tax=Aliiroseovarius halocynthiae TaxID=985055 RepID=A0A545SL63_9RHOB|nr:glycerate kinase [Aliiroseovarius halocynthiae]TQV65723.1 glycerate kinase [Aliiroseovarius halocynthiae]SMR83976.1 hydroxypyruvate reductase [Aliiroseovarius halocynthiae]
MDTKTLLHDMFDAALSAADPLKAVTGHLPPRPTGRVIVVGAGKASARMAQAVEAEWGPCEGIVIVPYGAALPCDGIRIVEGRHPVPDQAGSDAAHEILSLVSSADEDDFVLCLISGGGSALLSVPGAGLNLEDKQLINRALLTSGAAIDEMNIVRKHTSSIKGGRLAQAAYPAQVLTLVISDVPGDDPADIASGPTVPDPSTAADARAIIDRFDLDLPDQILAALHQASAETPTPSNPCYIKTETRVVAAPQASLDAATKVARAAGYTPVLLGDALEGEAREMGKIMGGIAKQVRRHGQPARGKVALISGGEATVTVTVTGTPGKGGRCTEFLLGFALATWDETGMAALACDTDGRDGSEHNAGAVWLPQHRANADREDALDHLSRHDAYSFFDQHDALVTTGPTHTNVNDFRVVLVETANDD